MVEDPIRHYYPILEGDELQIVYDIWNTGRNPLVISEIQTSCGCIAYDDAKRIVPPGDKERLTFRYDSSKNRGLVSHQIRLYGNFDSQSMMLLEFDVYVVPPLGRRYGLRRDALEKGARRTGRKLLCGG